MDFARIEKLMRMLEASSLEELDVTEGGMRIRLAKQKGGQPAGTIHAPVPADEIKPQASAGATKVRTIEAGIAGTFYRAPAPGAAPFVQVGNDIREGEQMAIIEAMKMLNPVEADHDGVVVDILIEDGDSVEPGTGLFRIEMR